MTILKGNALANKSFAITQGEFAVSDDHQVVLTTLLGSCVACCLWDDNLKIGGMNHMLLAGGKTDSFGKSELAGVAEMEYLINGIIKLGGERKNLRAKVFGGANMLSGGRGIGAANSNFVTQFLLSEGIVCLKSALGGNAARRIRFWPCNGRAAMRYAETSAVDPVPPTFCNIQGNAPELF